MRARKATTETLPCTLLDEPLGTSRLWVFLMGCQESFFLPGGQGKMQSTALLLVQLNENEIFLLSVNWRTHVLQRQEEEEENHHGSRQNLDLCNSLLKNRNPLGSVRALK